MYGEDFFRDQNYRFHKGVVLQRTFPERIRGWISVFTGAIILIYIAVAVGPSIQSKFAATLHRSKNLPGILNQATTTLDQVVASSIAKKASLPNLIPLITETQIPLNPDTPKMNGIFLLALAVWLCLKMLQFYHRSYYYYVEALLERGETGAKTPYTTPNYEVCEIYYDVVHGDLLKSFCYSVHGRTILRRCGVADAQVVEFLKARTMVVNYEEHESDLHDVFTLRDLATALVKNDPGFYQFLFALGIRDLEVVGAAEWVERVIKKRKQKARFWGRVALGQAPSFGADFAYGAAYTLSRYSRDLSREAISGGSNFRFVYGNEQITQLENVLSRQKEANAILVGEEGSGKMDVILDFARDIMNGYTHPILKHKRVMALDTNLFISSMKTKQELETGIIKLMNDAASSGNIILVIEDFPGFIHSGFTLDVDVSSLIDPYLTGSALQVIATADNARFHQFIEPNHAIMQRFEKVMLTEPADDALIRILEEVAEVSERRNRIFFTYPAVVEIVKSAENYFSDAIMPDKAIDILAELTAASVAKGNYFVRKSDVLDFIHQKTNIPVGNISEDERERLTNLEELMRNQVVGQEKALIAIANAMRRSRAGVRNLNRPIGTFLFLGPTGVGKTETAKALASVFFGNENAMGRLDMSEFQGEDGLNRLIGTMDGTPGILPVMLREQPYGVILLDEFEKTNQKTLDLFLQILDEGVFHDAQGKKSNARNTIFIATSNAGSQHIRDAIREGKDLEDAKKEIIDDIITAGKLKPELFNRFDGIILFHPLTLAEYKEIAELMLAKLQKRLREKSINLVVNDVLVEAMLAHGVDPDYGARPMQRAVQEIVEQKVAEKIIAGKLNQGSTLEFTREDFPELPSPQPAAPVQTEATPPPAV